MKVATEVSSRTNKPLKTRCMKSRLFGKVVADATHSRRRFLYVNREQLSCHEQNEAFC